MRPIKKPHIERQHREESMRKLIKIGMCALLGFGFAFGVSAKGAPKVTADEMAMLLATLMVAQKSCGLRTTDLPLNVVVARRGFDLVSFMPDGLYGPVVEVKRKKADEFITIVGPKKGCDGMNDTIKQFFPELVRRD